MKDIRVDSQGRQRCWNCGGLNFTHKRTFRSKALVGVGALLTKKKLKCQSCGEYNDTGRAKPYTGPASKRAGKRSGALELDERDHTLTAAPGVGAQPPPPAPMPGPPMPPGVPPAPPPAGPSYMAWNGQTYPWPPPAGWVQALDGRWWPEEQAPEAPEDPDDED